MQAPEVLALIQERLPRANQRALAGTMRQLIRDGRIPAGTRLPTIRDVAARTGMSPSAVGQAWRLLVRDQVVGTSTKAGSVVLGRPHSVRPVRYLRNMATAPPGTLDLGSPSPDRALLPGIDAAVAHALSLPDLQLAEMAPVIDELAAAARLHWPYQPEGFLAAHRVIDAVELALRTFARPGDAVAVEDPTTPRIIDNVEALGARVIPVPWREDGPDLKALRHALSTASVFVYQPLAQTPTGRTVTDEWLEGAAEIIDASRSVAVELVHEAALHGVAPTLGHRIPGAVVHIEGYAMSYGNDVRVALVSGSHETIDALAATASFSSRWVSRLLQGALAHLLRDPTARAQVASAAGEYRRRTVSLVGALRAEGFAIADPRGYRVWLPVADDRAVQAFLHREGVHVHLGSSHAIRKDRVSHIVLNGAVGLDDPARIARLIAAAEAEARGGPVRD